jgi:hypothetical protein
MKIKTRFKLLVIAVIIQIYHMIEHIAQYIQYEFYNIERPHGLIEQFDTEEIHLIFAIFFFLLLASIAHNYYPKKVSVLLWLFRMGVVMQGYHMIEHIIRVVDHNVNGCVYCAGILGIFFNNIPLHFVMNWVVLIIPLITFLLFRRIFK